MTKTVEFLFDFVSPTSYLAWSQLPAIAERAGAKIQWRPVFLGGIMEATGNRPPGTVENKGVWMVEDMARFAARYDVPFVRNPAFPMLTIAALRGALVAADDGAIERYNAAVYPAVWAEALDISKREVLSGVLDKAGFDADDIMTRAQEKPVKDRLRANTEDAIARGAFGCPTYFIDGVMHFGQDRLDFVAEALGG